MLLIFFFKKTTRTVRGTVSLRVPFYDRQNHDKMAVMAVIHGDTAIGIISHCTIVTIWIRRYTVLQRFNVYANLKVSRGKHTSLKLVVAREALHFFLPPFAI